MWITTGALPARTAVPAGATRVPVNWVSAKAAVDRASAAEMISAITLLLLFMVLLLGAKGRARASARPSLSFMQNAIRAVSNPRPVCDSEPRSAMVGRPVTVVVVVVVVPVPIVVAVAVIAVAAPGAVVTRAAALVAPELVHQVVDPVHAVVHIGPGRDPAQRPVGGVEGLFQPGEVVGGVAGIPPVALDLVMEVAGRAAEVAQPVQSPGLVPVRPAVVARVLAGDRERRLVDLVGDRRDPVQVASVREDGGAAVVSIVPLRLQSGDERERQGGGEDQRVGEMSSHGGYLLVDPWI